MEVFLGGCSRSWWGGIWFVSEGEGFSHLKGGILGGGQAWDYLSRREVDGSV